MSSEPVTRYDCVLSREHGDEPEDYEASMVPGTDWVMADAYVRVEAERHRLDMDAETFKTRMDEQDSIIARQRAAIDLLDTLPDAHKIAEQAATITQLRITAEEAILSVNMPSEPDDSEWNCAISAAFAAVHAALKEI